MRSMGHNKQERKRKEKEIKKKRTKKKRTNKNKQKKGFEATMSVEIITFKKLGFFPFTWPLFLLKYPCTPAMLQLEFGESKPEE